MAIYKGAPCPSISDDPDGHPPRYGEIAAAVHVSDKAIVPNVVSAVSWIERWCCLMPQIWCEKEVGTGSRPHAKFHRFFVERFPWVLPW